MIHDTFRKLSEHFFEALGEIIQRVTKVHCRGCIVLLLLVQTFVAAEHSTER